MPGFMETVLSLGVASVPHLLVIRGMLQPQDTEVARGHLASYLEGLSHDEVELFRKTLDAQLDGEDDPSARQRLEGIRAAVDRRGAPADDDFPADGSVSEQVAFMRALLEREKARGQMDPARAAALTDFVDNLRGYVGAEELRAPPDPEDRGAREADLRQRMAHLAGLRTRMEQLGEMQRDLRRNDAPPAGSRADVVAAHASSLIDDASGLLRAELLLQQGGAPTLESLLAELIGARARVLELAANDADVLRYEADALRSSAQALRQFHRRGHAMVARPIWPGGAARVEPSSVAFSGAATLRPHVGSACARRALSLREPRLGGVDQATWLWRGMQRAAVAVIDLSDAAPETYYQLGQAHALGTELLLTARAGTDIPFDVAQFVLEYRDEPDLAERLPEWLDAALYGVQTHGLSSLMHGTLRRCRDLVQRSAGAEHSGLLLSQLEATVDQPLAFRAVLDQLLGRLGNSRIQVLHPRWPARYPALNERRCFVVMPYSEQLATTQALYRLIDADLSAAGVEVVRGDEAEGQEIVASIWEETARASHVVVDLTNYNLNVCLELGMADAIGRDTLLIGVEGTSARRFPAIDKRRIHHYGADASAQQAVRSQVLAFTRRAPTLL